jgi:hypothetical protein
MTDISVSPNTEINNEFEPRFKRLKWLHFWAFLFMGIQTLCYGAVGLKDTEITPSVGFPDQCHECDGPSYTPSVKSLPDMDPTWLIVLFVALASFDHLVCFYCAWKFPLRASQWIFDIKSNPLRWIEYSISASIMALAISILCGILDVHL